MNTRLERIKQATVQPPYLFSFIFIFLVFTGINVVANQLYVTTPVLFSYNLKIVIPYVFFAILVAGLIALNINLMILRYKERTVNKEGGLTALGVFGGLMGGACPSCFVGVFPAVLGIFGFSISLSSLPLNGLEIQLVSALFLVIAVMFLTKDNVCKVKK